jgi:hypothetical protein
MKKLMKTRISILLAFLVTFPFSFCAQAIDIDFHDNGTITDGNVFGTVNIWDNANVIMTGGTAEYVYSYNTSTFRYQDGDVSEWIQVNDESTLIMSGGSVTASIGVLDSGVAYISGGNFNGIYSGAVGCDSSAKIYIYGQNFQMLPANDDHSSVFLKGNWLNGPSFDIYLRYLPQPYEQALGTNIFLVPEPATVSLLLFGILGARKLRRQKTT